MGRRIQVYGDESGDFKFATKKGVSDYFMITTITVEGDALCHDLLELRRRLMWDGVSLPSGFHAQNDSWRVRRAVFDVLDNHDFRIDATILSKAKAYDRVKASNLRFWKLNWFYHLRYVAPRVAASDDELLVVAAFVNTKMNTARVNGEIRDVVNQVAPCKYEASVVFASAEPGLQAADYCGWAIQRSWESGNSDVYDRIKSKISSEYRLF